MTRKPYRPAYVVLRIDTFLAELALRDPSNPNIESMVTVKQIHFSRDRAEAEVDRLNKLNADKSCHYCVQYSRLIEDL
ncbi:MAG: hypothetical protein AAGA29_01655 [Planctomycetota bacterium]